MHDVFAQYLQSGIGCCKKRWFFGPQAVFKDERMLCRQMSVAATTMIGCKVEKG